MVNRCRWLIVQLLTSIGLVLWMRRVYRALMKHEMAAPASRPRPRPLTTLSPFLETHPPDQPPSPPSFHRALRQTRRPRRGRAPNPSGCLSPTINDYMLPADHDRTQEHRTPSATRSRNWQAAPKGSNDTRPSAPSTKGQRNPERSAQKSGRQRTGEGAISGRPVSTQPATSSKLSKHKTQADQAAKLLAGR